MIGIVYSEVPYQEFIINAQVRFILFFESLIRLCAFSSWKNIVKKRLKDLSWMYNFCEKGICWYQHETT